MLEGAGVGIVRERFDAQLSSGLAPARNGSENFAEDSLRLGRLETKTPARSQRTGNGRIRLLLRNGGFARARATHFRHRVEVVSGRERPATRFAHEETMIAQVVVIVAGQERADQATP